MSKTPDSKCASRCIYSQHYSICVRFYTKVLQELGIHPLHKEDNLTGFGRETPGFWIHRDEKQGQPSTTTLYFQACSKEAVYNFFATAFESGGFCLAAPEPQQSVFGCKVQDPVGNVVQVCYQPEIVAGLAVCHTLACP